MHFLVVSVHSRFVLENLIAAIKCAVILDSVCTLCFMLSQIIWTVSLVITAFALARKFFPTMNDHVLCEVELCFEALHADGTLVKINT